MRLWNRLTGGALSALDWDGKVPEKVLVHRHTRDTTEIRTGATLTVRDGWAAGLVCNNQVADVCPPGTYPLDADSVATLLGAGTRWSPSRSTFHADVYFVSIRPWTGLAWALRNLTPSRSGAGQKLSLQGTCGFRITNPALFLGELLKPNVPLAEYPSENLRNVIAVRFGEWVRAKQITTEDLAADGERLIGRARARIAADLGRMGVELTEFLVAGSGEFPGYTDARKPAPTPTPSPAPSDGADDPLADKPPPASGPMSVRLPLSEAPPESGRMFVSNRPAPPSERILLPDPESDRDLSLSSFPLLNGWGAGPVSGRMRTPEATPPPVSLDKTPPPITYHLAVKGTPSGPLDLAKVKHMIQSGEVTPATLTWRKGLPEWVPAESVPELKALFAPAPPPLPSE
jgi:hypothetical protein